MNCQGRCGRQESRTVQAKPDASSAVRGRPPPMNPLPDHGQEYRANLPVAHPGRDDRMRKTGFRRSKELKG